MGEASAVWCGVVGKGSERVVGEASAVWWRKGERELKIAEKRVMNRGSAQSECFQVFRQFEFSHQLAAAYTLYGVQCARLNCHDMSWRLLTFYDVQHIHVLSIHHIPWLPSEITCTCKSMCSRVK